MSDLLPKVAVGPSTVRAAMDAAPGPAELEVGFGGGEHLAWQAAQAPETLFIGAEPFINGVAKLLSLIDSDGLTNVRVCDGDVRPLLRAIPDGRLQRVFVLHPDPWPKKRHHKRRIISREFLQEASRVLAPGGALRVSSDIPDYITWTLMQVHAHNQVSNDFVWQAQRAADWRDRPADWPQTRYEAKSLREGRVPTYLSFRRG